MNTGTNIKVQGNSEGDAVATEADFYGCIDKMVDHPIGSPKRKERLNRAAAISKAMSSGCRRGNFVNSRDAQGADDL